MLVSNQAITLLAHWKRLRGSTGLPSVRDFTDQFDAHLQPWLTAIDVVGDALHVRLMGGKAVEMWGVDLTGTELVGAFGKDVMDAVFGPVRLLHKHECGYVELKTATTSSGLEFKVERLALPLENDAGEGRRVIAVNAPLETTGYDPELAGTLSLSRIFDRQWLDLGSGVPAIALSPFDAENWRAEGGTVILDAEPLRP